MHGDQIDHAFETFLLADGQLDRNYAAAENILQRFHGALEAGQFAIHPVDDEGAGDIVFGGEIPDFFGDHLHAGGGVDENQRGIGGDQRGFGFVDEGAVARSVEQIDFDFIGGAGGLPFGEGDGGLNGNFSGDFFFVPVGDGGAFVDFAEARGHARSEQQRRYELRLPRIAVAYNANVTDCIGGVSFHD